MMCIRRVTLATLASLCALAGGLLFTGVSAHAAALHEHLTSFELGQHEGQDFGLAVAGGDLYVAGAVPGGEKSSLEKLNDSTGALVSVFPDQSAYFWQSVALGSGTGETEIYDLGEGVAVYSASGNLQNFWTGADTPLASFGCFDCNGPGAVAVDNSANPLSEGNVYVAAPEQGVVDIFEAKAGGGETYLAQITGPEPEAHPEVHFKGPYGVAVNQQNGDVIVLDGNAVDILEPTVLHKYVLVHRLTGTPSHTFVKPLYYLAVDGGNGDIYVAEGESNSAYQFNSEGAYQGQLEEGLPVQGLAVDPESHHVFVAGPNEHGAFLDVFGANIVVPDVAGDPASSVTPASATFNGTINPDKAGEATCRFEWGTTTEFGQVAPCEPEGVAEGGSPVPVHAKLSGLQPDTTYYYRLQATNRANGRTNPGEPSQDQQFTTPGPGLEEESVSNVTATSATLDATLNPHNEPTTYYFQYGAGASYGAEVPAAPGVALGSGEGGLEVGQHLQGLAPSAIYHYRVVAVSEPSPGVFEVFDGADETFLTQPSGSGFALLDGREWEMVTPPDKRGSRIAAAAQASVNGNAVTYGTDLPTESEPLGYTAKAQAFARRGPAGWVSQDIEIPQISATSAFADENRFFSEDLSLGIVQPSKPGTYPVLSGEASEPTPYLRTNYLNGNVDEPCEPLTMSCYRPLVTGKLDYANVPPGTVFGSNELLFLGANPDLSAVVFGPKSLAPEGVALTPEAVNGVNSIYEWVDGKLKLVGVPENQRLENLKETASKAGAFSRHGISNDGSRVIFNGEFGGDSGLLLRDMTGKGVVQLDAAQGGPESGGGTFQVASSDDSRVYFTDYHPLTANSGADGQHEFPDLYECEIVEGEVGKPTCKLTDLTPLGARNGGANVLGVLGASEDGSYVYFVANAKLTPEAVSGSCGEHGAVSRGESCDIYVRHDGATRVVALLSGADRPDWEEEKLTGRVSPNGEWLAFMSQRDLTGYVTRDVVSGKLDEETYLYDAAGAGRLVCASCNPTGARPTGFEKELNPFYLAPTEGWEAVYPSEHAKGIDGDWLDGMIPKLRGTGSHILSNSGRLFFDSSDALVSQDVNGTVDAYEYEPAGAGSCATSSVTYSERSSGCVNMISSGTSAEESVVLEASASGGDVFLLTAAKLVPQDFDTSLDVYDAHECTAASPCFPAVQLPPPPCTTGDACKASPTPQPAIFGEPSSATFSGAGNIVPSVPTPVLARKKGLTQAQKLARALKACRKQRGKGRSVCERKARARYGAKQSRKTNATKKGRG
jgi:hypothetical protein